MPKDIMGQEGILSEEGFLIVNGSPRAGGNTDFLIGYFLPYLKGENVVTVNVRDMSISPCRGCESCFKTGMCVLKDDMDVLYELVQTRKKLLFFSPVFFGGVPSTLKAAIDRFQPFWAKKHVFKQTMVPNKRGLITLIGGTSFEKGFDCSALSVKWLFNTVGVNRTKTLYYYDIENKDDFSKFDIESDIKSALNFLSGGAM